MRRREFITLIGAAATAWPLAAGAQQSGKLPIIGVLGVTGLIFGPWVAAFAERLSKLGWIEGRTVIIEYRWSEGRSERVAEIAAELARRGVDVILAYGGAVAVLRQATASIPIVFAPANDAIGAGLVASFSHPGGNVTGLSVQQGEIAGKRFELLHQVVPNIRRLGIIFDASYSAAVLETSNVQAMAHDVGLEVAPHGIQRAEDIVPAFGALKGQADALYVAQDALIDANNALIITLALSAKLPTISTTPDFAKAGALMSYGPNMPALFRRAAEIVDKILRGTKPGDIPVEQPTEFDLVINLKTAKALNLTIPDKMLAIANDVIDSQ